MSESRLDEQSPKLHPRLSAQTRFLLAPQGQAKCRAVHTVGEAELDSQDSFNHLCPSFFSLSKVSLKVCEFITFPFLYSFWSSLS